MKSVRIDLEGIDGSGKTTALKYLLKKLQQHDKRVLSTQEVGSPHIRPCTELRKIVLNPEFQLYGESMEFIFAAMHLENDGFYKSVENKYDYVLSDRGWFSHLAYTDHNVSEEFTQKFYLDFFSSMASLPDVVVYLKVDSSLSEARRKARNEALDAIEIKGSKYQESVGKSFEKYLNMYSNLDIMIIDAAQDIAGVEGQLDGVVEKLLNR